jgi:hypothetical protein
MIVRILNEGQWELSDEAVRSLNLVDDELEKAVAANDQERLTATLGSLLDQVRDSGRVLPDGDLRDSDLILPASDSTVEEVRALLSESSEGLIPN